MPPSCAPVRSRSISYESTVSSVARCRALRESGLCQARGHLLVMCGLRHPSTWPVPNAMSISPPVRGPGGREPGAMQHYTARPIPPAALKELRTADDAGRAPAPVTDDEGGAPLRCCLRRSTPGREDRPGLLRPAAAPGGRDGRGTGRVRRAGAGLRPRRGVRGTGDGRPALHELAPRPAPLLGRRADPGRAAGRGRRRLRTRPPGKRRRPVRGVRPRPGRQSTAASSTR